MSDEIDEAQMAADFASMPEPINGPMRRARRLVEKHIESYGMVPHPDKIKEAIAVELGLAEILAADRARAERGSNDAAKQAIELAYGLLWMVGCDKSTKRGEALYLARKALYERLDRQGQAKGITAAREAVGVHHIPPFGEP